ncbi:MAG: hypothetical protein AB8B63_04000, partial [Granulosicoccus sp.]
DLKHPSKSLFSSVAWVSRMINTPTRYYFCCSWAINRHRWDYEQLKSLLDDPASDQARVLSALSKRLRLRSRQPAFHPDATQFTLPLDERIFGIWRQSQDRQQSIFALHNVSADTVELPVDALNLIADEHWFDLISDQSLESDTLTIQLAPYQCSWITNIRISE